jgi:hypothetical protein
MRKLRNVEYDRSSRRSSPLPPSTESVIKVHHFVDHRNGEFALCCPSCGFEYMHHDVVTVFARDEDKEQTIVTQIVGRKTIVTFVASNKSKNPSARRDGLAVMFWCEGCDSVNELCLEQHKGQTFFSWRSLLGK